MKKLGTLLASCVVATLLACLPGCSTSGEDICKRAGELCPASSTTKADGGVTATTTFQCKADEADDISNKDEVKDCLDAASNCDGAIACLLKAKK